MNRIKCRVAWWLINSFVLYEDVHERINWRAEQRQEYVLVPGKFFIFVWAPINLKSIRYDL